MRAVVVCAMLLSGCLGGSAPAQELIAAFDLTLDAVDCQEAVVLRLVDPTHAGRLVPEGFVPADAQRLLETPTLTGRAAVVVQSTHCGRSDFVEAQTGDVQLLVLVEPPPGPGEREPAIEYYELLRLSAQPKMIALFETVGWDVHRAAVHVGVHDTSTGAEAALRAQVEDGPWFEASLRAMNGEARQQMTRYWHLSEEGLSRLDVVNDGTAHDGLASCRARGPFATALASEDCPVGETYAQAWPEMRLSATFRFDPDGRPT